MTTRSTLTWRVLLILCTAVATPTLIVGTLAISRTRSSLEQEVARGNLALIRSVGAGLDARLQSARRTLDVAAAQWADGRQSMEIAAADPHEQRATNRILRRLRRDVPLFSKLAILSPDGAPMPASDTIAVPENAGAHTFGGYIGDITFEEGKPRILVFSQARSRTGELIGTFVAQIDLGFIEDTLALTRLGPGARLLVVDGEGLPVARSDGQSVTRTLSLRSTHPAVDRALGSATEGTVTADGTVAVYRNLSTYQSLRGVRWAIILEQPEADAYALAHDTTRNTLIALIAALAVALLGGILLATRLTRPLRALAERADAIAAGGAKPADPIRAPGEIGALAERLEQMARRLQEREALREALARGDRLATVGTMSASVAHEINNPLTTVLGYAKLLMEDKPDEHPDLPGLELIADEAERMQGIVRGLLDYARARPPQSGEVTDVNDLVERTRALLAPQLRKSDHVDIQLELSGALPAIAVDPHSLQQVFVNLAQNAAQAMTEGGTLTIHTELGPGATAVHILFSDQGPGVPVEANERIFDPFYTTKGAGLGTGLGLAVAKHLVNRARGTISVEDADGGRGACFRVVIPIVE